MINILLEKYEPCQACGYDIGCSMDGTCHRSKLGEKATERKLQLLVNAFHGYQHNRLCQCDYHPLYREGIGMEDMETNERLFSVLNGVARCIRSASTYHWMQAIHLRIKQINEDRYETLGASLYPLCSFTFLSCCRKGRLRRIPGRRGDDRVVYARA